MEESSSGGGSGEGSSGSSGGSGRDYSNYWNKLLTGVFGSEGSEISVNLSNTQGGNWLTSDVTMVSMINGQITVQGMRDIYVKNPSMGVPTTSFEILHSFIYDPGHYDWFLETTKTPTNTGYRWKQQAVLLTYDEKGELVDFMKNQRAFETFEYGTLEQYESPIKYISEPFEITSQMMGVTVPSINYNCSGCLTAPSVWDKYRNFILSPNERPKNRMSAVSGPHR